MSGTCTSEPSSLPFLETEHGRLRRRQRGIDKKDLQAALLYGTSKRTHDRVIRKENGEIERHPARIYTYKDIVYIVDTVTHEEITCYAEPIKLDYVPLSTVMLLAHETHSDLVQNDIHCWTSNTVIIVDTSGSMRTSDVWGCRTRLGAVWVSVALDLVAFKLESGNALPTDVISIVALNEEAEVIIKEWPWTWLSYNKIVEIYELALHKPSGHGPFIPALQVAEDLLFRSIDNTTCALALVLLSDGAPSDHKFNHLKDTDLLICEQIESMASKFGRRLTFTAIGIGDQKQFTTLQSMVDCAKDYDVKSELALPSLSSEGIGTAFTTTVTSTIQTQTELTSIGTMKQDRQVRKIVRESRSIASQRIKTVNKTDFWIYPKNQVKRYKLICEWDPELNKHRNNYREVPLQREEASFVAFSKKPFGEGAERFAFRFFELNHDGYTIVGQDMVAKECRFVWSSTENGVGEEEERKTFTQKFCKTQQAALRFATKFNAKLDKLNYIHPHTPRVHFLDCSIYELDDADLGCLSVLVEDKLDHTKWYKWNSNDGHVNGQRSDLLNTSYHYKLEPIAESQDHRKSHDVDDEIDDNEDDEDDDDDDVSCLRKNSGQCSNIRDVANGFIWKIGAESREEKKGGDDYRSWKALSEGCDEDDNYYNIYDDDDEEEDDEYCVTKSGKGDKERGTKKTEADQLVWRVDVKPSKRRKGYQATGMLGILEEGSDNSYSSEDEALTQELFSASDVAQAFSHFTYMASARTCLVCDLQGVYDESVHRLMLSDPVIHHYESNHKQRGGSKRIHKFGRTDHGRDGFDKFFQTHKEHHGKLCNLMIRGFRSYRNRPIKKSLGKRFHE